MEHGVENAAHTHRTVIGHGYAGVRGNPRRGFIVGHLSARIFGHHPKQNANAVLRDNAISMLDYGQTDADVHFFACLHPCDIGIWNVRANACRATAMVPAREAPVVSAVLA